MNIYCTSYIISPRISFAGHHKELTATNAWRDVIADDEMCKKCFEEEELYLGVCI